MNFPCVQEGQCFDPANPLRNLSSEDSDGPEFIALAPGNWFTPPPPLGSNFRQTSWAGAGSSRTSLEDAILQAHNESLTNTSQSWETPPTIPLPNPNPTPSGPNGVPPLQPPAVPPDSPPPPVYFSGPQAVTVFCSDGNPFTVLVPQGLINGLSQAEANNAARTYIEQTILQKRFCLSDVLDLTVCPNTFYSEPVTVTGGSGPFTFTADALPDGLSLAPTGDRTALLSGFITELGSSTFSVRATDPQGNFMEKTYNVSVLGITDTSLPSGTVSTPYSHQLTTLGAGSNPEFELDSGSLPAGLSLSAGGLISGTPTNAETASFRVAVTANEQTCFSDFSIEITGAGLCPATPAGLSWTFDGIIVNGTPTFSYAAAGATGSYNFDCPANGDEVEVHFNSCIQNATGAPKTLRIEFTTTYSASAPGLPFPGTSTAVVESISPPPAFQQGCTILPPFGGSCGDVGNVAQWDIPLPALSDTTFEFRVLATAGGAGATANIVGSFVVTVF